MGGSEAAFPSAACLSPWGVRRGAFREAHLHGHRQPQPCPLLLLPLPPPVGLHLLVLLLFNAPNRPKSVVSCELHCDAVRAVAPTSIWRITLCPT